MHGIGKRLGLGIAAGAFALVAASPVAASAPVTFTIDDWLVVDHACGIVEETHLTGSGRAYFDAEGDWIRDVINFEAVGTFTGRSGVTYTGRSHQNVVVTPDGVASSGQGIFLRGPGGVLNYDVGRYLFDQDDLSTRSATPKILAFDDIDANEALEAALCAALG